MEDLPKKGGIEEIAIESQRGDGNRRSKQSPKGGRERREEIQRVTAHTAGYLSGCMEAFCRCFLKYMSI